MGEDVHMIEIEVDIESIQVNNATVTANKEMVMQNQNNLTQILLSTNATPILRQADVGYFCHFCDSHYREPADLKQHNLDSHNNDESRNVLLTSLEKRKWIKLDVTHLTCRLCNTNIDCLDNLYEHLKINHEMTIYTDIKQLIVPFNFECGSIRCCICSYAFEKFKKLMEHMHMHYRNFICEICDQGFITSEVLAKHLQVHNTGTFACHYCPKIFDTQRKRRYHERFTHLQGNTFKYKCGYCVERFMESHQKDEHLNKVHGVPANVTCEACDKTFKCNKYLTKHIRREHLHERRFQCPDCDSRFFSVGELNRHSVKHTGVKDFQCEICLKSFGRKNTLVEHRRIHSGERFTCDHCGNSFAQKCNWRSHMKIKHGDIVH